MVASSTLVWNLFHRNAQATGVLFGRLRSDILVRCHRCTNSRRSSIAVHAATRVVCSIITLICIGTCTGMKHAWHCIAHGVRPSGSHFSGSYWRLAAPIGRYLRRRRPLCCVAIWHRMQPSSMTVLLSLHCVVCVRLSCGLVLIVTIARVPRSQSLEAVSHTCTPPATRERRSRRS